jgi:mannose-6-phosphate isomerase-like protein (cupin superfamily)
VSCFGDLNDREVNVSQQGDGWKLAAIDDIPPVKPDWPATWKSVRHYFGILGFGINAVTKDEGNVLIPEHEHDESGEQELYFIHRGEAMATLNGKQVRVSAGSAVVVEGSTSRKFEAVASPTTLIVVGGTPGQAYEVGEWEK